MEVNLRKASALSKALLDAAKRVPLATTVEVSIYANPNLIEVVEGGSKALDASLKKAQGLIDSGFAIRAAIGEANAGSGVNALLSERAVLDAQEKIVAAFSDAGSAVDYDVARAKLSALKQRHTTDTRGYGIPEELSLGVITPDIAASAAEQLRTIRRRKTAIADELLALNTTTKIVLSADVVAHLTDSKLI